MNTSHDFISSYYFSKQKRIFDLTLSTVGFILLIPFLIIISVSILLTSGWPIFFTQLRTGKNNKPFKMIKFRTMYKGAHQDQKKLIKKNESPFPTFKISDDPRFIGIGKFLSKTGMDEIPQLINILKGEMSLIGPRPLPVEEASNLPTHWQIRHTVRPGILSLWALSKSRHSSKELWEELETETLKFSSVKKDVQILLRALEIPLQYFLTKLKK